MSDLVERLRVTIKNQAVTMETQRAEIEQLRIEEDWRMKYQIQVGQLQGELKRAHQSIAALETEIERLRNQIAAANHHPDCNYWKWDWRYSWSPTDCTCAAEADNEFSE